MKRERSVTSTDPNLSLCGIRRCCLAGHLYLIKQIVLADNKKRVFSSFYYFKCMLLDLAFLHGLSWKKIHGQF